MIGRIRNARLGVFLNVGIGIAFIITAVIVVIAVNYNMRQQALIEAQTKARIILDRNLATHTYFSQIMKPSIFAWSEPFRSKEYFDHTWMSSTFAIREIEKYFKSLNSSGYSFKDAAIDARSPENEADEYERAFIEQLNTDKRLESESSIRNIDGKPYLVVLRKGEDMEASCLKCHSHPRNAPKGLTDHYGSERSFNRKASDTVSAVSLRIPLAEAYAEANIFSLKFSAILIAVLACLFFIQYWFYRRYLLEPLNVMREKANEIAIHEEKLGEQISQPLGRELRNLTTSFNEMSAKLRHERDNLEGLIVQRTEQLRKEKDFADSLIQTAQAIVLVLDTTGHIVSINAYMENMSGFSLKEVRGKDWFSTFIPERDRNSIRELFRNAIDGIQKRGNVNPIVTKDGRELQIEWYDKTLKDEKGNVVGVLSIGQDITERKQADEALHQSEANFRRSLDESPLGVRIVTVEGETIYANRAILDIYGYDSIEEFKTTSVEKRYTPESHAEFLIRREKRKRGDDVPSEYDISIVKKDDEVRHLQVFRKEILWAGERQFQVLYNDITERKAAEEALKEANETLDAIINSSPLAIIALDPDGNVTRWNPAAEQMFGWLESEVWGQFLPIVSEDKRDEHLKLRERVMRGEAFTNVEVRCRKKDSSPIDINISTAPLGDSQGRVIGIMSVSADITEHKRAVEEKRRMEERSRKVVEDIFRFIPEGVLVFSLKMELLRQNQAFRELVSGYAGRLGFAEDELENLIIDKVKAGLRVNNVKEIKIARKHEPSEQTFDEFEELVLELDVARILFAEEEEEEEEEEARIVVSIKDITERKQAEEELRTSSLQLRALAKRLEQIREEERIIIAREIHDEMGGGLTGFKMDLSWLLSRMNDADPGEERVAIVDKIHTANALIDQMIQVVRRISTDLRPSILDDLGLIAALEWQLSEFTKRTEIQHEFATTSEFVNMEEDTAVSVFRIFQEALTNVARHARATKVVVVVREGERSLFGDETLVLEVKDNGRGITEEEIRNPESLGLLGMKERVLTFGGELSIRGKPGGGTTLVLKIPRKQGESS